MIDEGNDMERRPDEPERVSSSPVLEDLTRQVRTLEHRVENLMSAIWVVGIVVAVLAVVIGLFTPYAVEDEDESSSLAGMVFSAAEAFEDGDTVIVWIPLALWFVVAVATVVLLVGLRNREASSAWQTTARVTSWIFVLGCLGGFLLLLIASSRSRSVDVVLLPPGLLFLGVGALIAATLTTAGRDWIRSPTELTSRRL